MGFVCTEARFKIWDGRTTYTVEFVYGIMTWYVFPDEDTSGAVFQKKIDPKKSKTPTRDLALDVLEEYLGID